MVFEIDSFNVDLTRPFIAWGNPVWTLLIIDREATFARLIPLSQGTRSRPLGLYGSIRPL